MSWQFNESLNRKLCDENVCLSKAWIKWLTSLSLIKASHKMITDNDLGFIANFMGIFLFALVIAYHYVVADPKYEGV
nr:dolichyl-diphosphooligosaccharide--protein glycosyltransferase subunit 4A [Tanacetum cinerariifolium]